MEAAGDVDNVPEPLPLVSVPELPAESVPVNDMVEPALCVNVPLPVDPHHRAHAWAVKRSRRRLLKVASIAGDRDAINHGPARR